MGVLEIVTLLLVPLFPLTVIYSLIFKKSFLLFPFAVVLSGFVFGLIPEMGENRWLSPLALISAILYAIKGLSARSLKEWFIFQYFSFLGILWILSFLGVSDPALGLIFTAPFLSAYFLVKVLEGRYATTSFRILKGLGKDASTSLSLSTVIVALSGVAPFPLFLAVLLIGLKPLEGAVAIGLVWFLWGWSGTRLLVNVISGEPLPTIKVSSLKIKEMIAIFLPLIVASLLSLYLKLAVGSFDTIM